MCIFIGLLVLAFIVKFIYDSFLTNNTEKRYEQYIKEGGIPVKGDDVYRPLVKANESHHLKNTYPNFVRFCTSSHVKGVELLRNESYEIKYSIPILTFGRNMGMTIIGLRQSPPHGVQYFTYALSSEGKMYEGGKVYLQIDLSVEDYNTKFGEISMSLLMNEEYRKMTVGG